MRNRGRLSPKEKNREWGTRLSKSLYLPPRRPKKNPITAPMAEAMAITIHCHFHSLTAESRRDGIPSIRTPG